MTGLSTRALILGSARQLHGRGLCRARHVGAEVVAGLQPGGQMTITTDVENYPLSTTIKALG
jgi:hypothetical protein